MDLGEKLRQARLEAGLSQRQLCGEALTRNMLSQIEHGAAKPSIDTLLHLARGLGKPVGYFLDQEEAVSPNQKGMLAAREAFAQGSFSAAEAALQAFQPPDPVFQQEWGLLSLLTDLALARQALDAGKLPYARKLLIRAAQYATIYRTPDLERERVLLLYQAEAEHPEALSKLLPADDRALLLRAQAALDQEDPRRCAAILDAAEDFSAPRWNFLRGQACLALADYAQAARYLTLAYDHAPKQTAPLLERCYRELEDYKMAYFYACQQRAER